MFKYEMHIHSSPCSGGGDDIINHINTLKAKGYAGMVITNHFFNGDNRIDRSLPWDEFVEPYRADYERGRKYAEQVDFDLIFGIEEHVGQGKEVLIFGISPDFLSENPVLKGGNIEDYIRLVHAAGGMIFQAHPYRAKAYIKEPGPLDCIDSLDGIEVYNAANRPKENEAAARLAEEKGLRCTAGSDGHSAASAGRAGIISPVRIRNGEELVRVLRSGDYGLYKEA